MSEKCNWEEIWKIVDENLCLNMENLWDFKQPNEMIQVDHIGCKTGKYDSGIALKSI